ncbi:MAG: hypothetical protein CMJ49_13680 [Planctomycetaceae bacterium]|jgi:phosphate uptake regulator|nr:hypothetical protein [Planctomycetaceae bacterium]
MWKQLIQAWKADNLLEQAWDESFQMLEIDREMFLEAVRVLRESDDAEINTAIRKRDKEVNRYEREVRRKVMTHCTVAGARDLPGGMVLVSIVIDIERIGDYCKNILDLAAAHPKRLSLPDYETSISEVEQEVRRRFDQTIDILREHDTDRARDLMATFKEDVGRTCDKMVDDAVAGNVTPLWPGDAVALALYARYLKRIGAHLNNVITSTVNPFERIGFREKRKSSDGAPPA